VACSQDGFEGAVDDTSLAGWSWEGDAQVIEHLGATPALEGTQMALVSTGLFIEENGALWKSFCPPAGPTTLEFAWRFYSEEFVEWCNSTFQDQLQVSVTTADAAEVLLSVTVQDLCPPSECPGCGTNYMGLEEADVAFDVGGVWATPWVIASLPLPAAFSGGEGLTVRFDVSDVGDGIYDSAVLVDDVRLVGSTPCVSDAACADENPCTLDVCDPLTGLCSNTMDPECCFVDADCDDGDYCTVDICELGVCINTTQPNLPGCCQSDADCDDGDPCTEDQCFLQQCFNPPNGNPGCCEAQILLDEDFEDGQAQGWTLEPDQQPLPGFGWQITSPGHASVNALQGFGMSFFPGMESVASTPTLNLPAGETVTLDFWYQGLSDENQCPGSELTVLVGNALLFSDCQQASGWLHASVDLTDLAPGNVVLEFIPGGDSGFVPLVTYAIDDVVVSTSCDDLPIP